MIIVRRDIVKVDGLVNLRIFNRGDAEAQSYDSVSLNMHFSASLRLCGRP
jgi:hypothetical protein